MLIATQNAEQKAVQYLENIGAEHKAAWRALRYKGQYYQEENTDYGHRYHFVRIMTNMIRQMIKEDKYEYGVFFCDDGDVLLVALGISAKLIDNIKTALEHISKTPEENQKVYEFYDFSVRFEEFKRLCRHKLALVEEARQRAEEEKKQDLTESDYLKEFRLSSEHFREVSEERRNRSQLKIMVVDDDEFSRTLITRLMGAKGQILSSADGLDALETYMYNAPDIMFLDIELPKVNGQTVLKKIMEFDQRAFVVMISGYGHKRNIIEAMQSGAKGFVGKPFAKDRVLGYLDACRKQPG